MRANPFTQVTRVDQKTDPRDRRVEQRDGKIEKRNFLLLI